MFSEDVGNHTAIYDDYVTDHEDDYGVCLVKMLVITLQYMMII